MTPPSLIPLPLQTRRQWTKVTSDTCVQMMNSAIARELAPYAGPAIADTLLKHAGSQPPVRESGSKGPLFRPSMGLFEASSQQIDWNYDVRGDAGMCRPVVLPTPRAQHARAHARSHSPSPTRPCCLAGVATRVQGVHFRDQWYDAVVRLLLRSLCPEDGD